MKQHTKSKSSIFQLAVRRWQQWYTDPRMRIILTVVAWWIISAGVIVGSVAWLNMSAVNAPRVLTAQTQAETAIPAQVTQQVWGEVKGVSTSIEMADGRQLVVANFLKRHSSPLTPHGDFAKKIVEIADRYGLDYRLLPAIAMQESNLCKHIPEGTHNCLGFGIHERGTLGFNSYEEAFDRAGRELRKNYIDRGLTTPEEIMTKYTPSSNGSWAASVNQWMAEMRYDDSIKGKELKSDANLLEFVSTSAASAVPSPSPQAEI